MEYGYIMVAGFSFKVKTILKGKSIKKCNFPKRNFQKYSLNTSLTSSIFQLEISEGLRTSSVFFQEKSNGDLFQIASLIK